MDDIINANILEYPGHAMTLGVIKAKFKCNWRSYIMGLNVLQEGF